MMKSKYWIYGILALAVIGIIFISGCVKQHAPESIPSATQPSETLETTPPQTEPESPPTQKSQFLIYTPVPGTANDAQLKFAAGHFDAIQPKGYIPINKITKYNPDVNVFMYKNTKGWHSSSSDFDSLHESWFWHSSNSLNKADRIQFAHSPIFWLMDITDDEFIDYWIQTAGSDLDKSGYTGIFMDDANPILKSTYYTALPYGYSDEETSNAVYNMIDKVKKAFPDKLIIYNGLFKLGQGEYTGMRNLEVADGGVKEGFIQKISTGGFISEEEWKTLMDMILTANQPTKYKLLACRADVGNIPTDGRMFCFTSFLLVKDDYTVFSFRDKKYFTDNKQDTGLLQYYPEYTIKLGEPLDNSNDLNSYFKDGVFERNFEKGKILVNPSTSSKTVTLDKTYRLVKPVGGGPITNDGKATGSLKFEDVDQVTISSQSGVVLLDF